MRPKITFRDPRVKCFFRGITPPAGEGIDDAALAELISIWRAKYQRFDDRAINPLRMDVRATLERLTTTPDSEAGNALRLLDSETRASLIHAALLDFRRANPEPAPCPSDALLIQSGRVRELAALALSVMTENTGGRPRINSLDHFFACELVRHWIRIKGKKPSAQYIGTDFTEWAADMFARVGAPRKDHTKVLQQAIKKG